MNTHQNTDIDDSANDVLVDEQWLVQQKDNPGVVLIDTRPASAYWEGHLPGARHLDPSIFTHIDTSETGLRSLRDAYTWAFSALGISGAEERVVFYENRSDSRAARGAWVLEYLGHPRVSLLDGGLGVLRTIQKTRDAPAYNPSPLSLQPNDDVVIGRQELLHRLNDETLQVLDTRRQAEYTGHERRAEHGGHVPGAKHRDHLRNIAEDGRFQAARTIRRAYLDLGFDVDREIAAYCGSGARAAHTYYALKIAGFKHPRNYTGSWSEWGNHADMPFVTAAS